MSYNERVCEATERMADAYGTPEYGVRRDEYFRVLEEELMKDNGGGWLELEDPVDCMIDTIENIKDGWNPETEAAFLEWVLPDYIRYWEIREFHELGMRDCELIEEARYYIGLYR